MNVSNFKNEIIKSNNTDFSLTIVDDSFEDRPYEEAQLHFVEDYDRENPVTAIRAWQEYIKILESRNMNE